MLVSWLVIEGGCVWARVRIGFGIRRPSWSPDFGCCEDLLKARVDLIVTASESLLSEGRRLLTEGACIEFRGNGEGHKVNRGSSLDEIERREPSFESTLGLL